MNFLKKWISCIVSFVAGVCGLALSACSGMIVNASIDASAVSDALSTEQTTVVKGFEVITDSELYTTAQELGITSEFVCLKVFAFITLIASILLIAYSVILLLKNLNVIKCDHKAFNIVTICLNCLLLAATIGLLISSSVYANALEVAQIAALKDMYTAQLPLIPGLGITAETAPAVVAQMDFNVVAKIGVYQPLMLAISAIAAITSIVFSFIKRKDA